MDIAAREMTPEEWAERLVGASADDIAVAIASAIERGRCKGRKELQGAVDHFEVAYRYAINASRAGADASDLLASAETMANIAYGELRKEAT